MTKKGGTARRPLGTLELDEALMVLFIGAMNANRHVAREELARAHHLIWSTRRFRRKSGETVGRLIDRAKRRLEEQDAASVMQKVARMVPTRLRSSVLALVADLLLADGKIDAPERRFLERLAVNFKIQTQVATNIIDVILTKNRLWSPKGDAVGRLAGIRIAERRRMSAMARASRVLVATDGSDHARAAVKTAAQFPWPADTRVCVVVARQTRAEHRRSILLSALDRRAEAAAQGARRTLSRRWPDVERSSWTRCRWTAFSTRPGDSLPT